MLCDGDCSGFIMCCMFIVLRPVAILGVLFCVLCSFCTLALAVVQVQHGLAWLIDGLTNCFCTVLKDSLHCPNVVPERALTPFSLQVAFVLMMPTCLSVMSSLEVRVDWRKIGFVIHICLVLKVLLYILMQMLPSGCVWANFLMNLGTVANC